MWEKVNTFLDDGTLRQLGPKLAILVAVGGDEANAWIPLDAVLGALASLNSSTKKG
jgi:hypothetical protein